jgi:phospholipid transport system substrate-binding protein
MRFRIGGRLAAALALVAALFAAPAAHADQAAEQFMQAILDEAEASFKSGEESVVLEAIADLVDKYVDMRRVGLFTLGQYARQMGEEQRGEYFPLFEQYATLVYQNALVDYSGQSLRVAGSVDRSPRDIIVNTKIVDAPPGDDLANVTVHWRVYRSADGQMSVVDAGADNVWLAIEQRGQFTSIIANNGGGEKGIDALIAKLREKVDDQDPEF